jgi:short subunit dehydrogenase-like uncharacterized protein
MSGTFMIYGATGYTGKLLARTAKALGMRPVIAGRNEARLKSIAGQHGFDYLKIDLRDRTALHAGLSQVDAVLHAAGPFSRTSRPMLDACLATGVHYLDITGEIDVFEACAVRDAEAREAGIMVMPGTGFDVVPSDCLAAHLKARLPDAIELTLAIRGLSQLSHGTAKTMIEGLGMGTRVRRDGRIVALKSAPRRDFDFGDGPRPAIAAGWGDVSTAFHSTGIPAITVYMEASPELEKIASISGFTRRLMGLRMVQRRLKRKIDEQPEGPTDAQRRAGHAVLVGEAVNAAGDRVVSRLDTPETYTLTAMTALEITYRVLTGAAQPGFQTPSRVFGAEFITEFDGCILRDIAG